MHERTDKVARRAKGSSALTSVCAPDLARLQEANECAFLAKVAAKEAVDALNQGEAEPAAALMDIAARYARRFTELSTALNAQLPDGQEQLPPEARVAKALAEATVTPAVGPADGIRLAERALAMFDSNGGFAYAEASVRVLNIVGANFWKAKRFEEALHHFQRAEQICDEAKLDDAEGSMSLLFNIIQTAKSLNRADEVARVLDRIKALAEAGPDKLEDVENKVTAAKLLQSEERFEEALAVFRKAYVPMDEAMKGEEVSFPLEPLVETLNGMTEILNQLGRTAEAAPYVNLLMGIAQQYGTIAPVLTELNYVSFNSKEGVMSLLRRADGTGVDDSVQAVATVEPVLSVARDYDLRKFRVRPGAKGN